MIKQMENKKDTLMENKICDLPYNYVINEDCINNSCIEQKSMGTHIIDIRKPLYFRNSEFLKNFVILIKKELLHNNNRRGYNYKFQSYDIIKNNQMFNSHLLFRGNANENDILKYLYIHGAIIEYYDKCEKFTWAYPLNFPIPFEGCKDDRIILEKIWISGNLIFRRIKCSNSWGVSWHYDTMIEVCIFNKSIMKYENILRDVYISDILCLCSENIAIVKSDNELLSIDTQTGIMTINVFHNSDIIFCILPNVYIKCNSYNNLTSIVSLNDAKPAVVSDKVLGIECRICMNDISDSYIFLPCGHGRFDLECAGKFKLCPVCRRPVDKIQKIFLD
jgi:hypothetical protein